MEICLQVQRPVCCSRTIFSDGPHFKIKPFLGFLPRTTTQSSQSSSCCKDYRVAGVSYQISASADFSRRRQRKASTPRPKDSTAKGFVPRMQVRTSNQRKDQKDDEEKEGPVTPASKEYAGPNKKTIELNFGTDEEQTVEIDRANIVEEGNAIDGIVDEVRKSSGVATLGQLTETGGIGIVEEVNRESHHKKQISKSNVADGVDKTGLESKNLDTVKKGDSKLIDRTDIDENIVRSQLVKPESPKDDNTFGSKGKDYDNSSLKKKLEIEAKLREQALQRLAGVNFSLGNRIFCYPEEVKPDQTIEVFLNRSLSTLNDEPDVIIMGAFNDWRWKSFTIKLNKTNLNGDWWSCQVHVPKEAYKMDFVFFNGKDVYDNNDKKDFCVIVKGGIDVLVFEDFLLEEKRRELVKLAKEQAERERHAEEQRRIEAEKVAREADRAQARGEAERRRGMLQELMKKAVSSVDNLWFIEPKEFKGEDWVKLFYKRGSGPLANAKEIWIHGGYNNWKDGLSMVARLESSERKDGDWWYTDEKRQAESTRIREKYPDRIPVIVEKTEKSDIPDIDKKKYLVPADLTVGQFVYVIRKRIKINAEKAIFVFVKDILPPTAALMSAIYEEYKEDDGFIYMTYSGENTFGSLAM